MKLIAGLGNPGRRYERTRHNAGFMVADELARRGNVRFRRWWMSPARAARRRMPGGETLLLVKPQTFMNRSGEAVRAVLRKERLTPGDLVVVVDDLALPLGRLRIRRGGSDGGHNGLRSVIASLGTSDFMRLRVGVGPPPERGDWIGFVLGPFARGEEELFVRRAADAAEMLAVGSPEEAMNAFNAERNDDAERKE